MKPTDAAVFSIWPAPRGKGGRGSRRAERRPSRAPAQCLFWLAAALCFGCSSSHDTPPPIVQSPVYAIPAKELAADVKQIVSSPPISLPVQDQGDGTLLTGWQEPFRGDFHVVRYWHERTRYRISIVPDFADPSHRSRLQITDESEQRPDEGGPNVEAKTWHPAPNNRRAERSGALLQQIQLKLEAPVATRPVQ
jgi:hypothetical protein